MYRLTLYFLCVLFLVAEIFSMFHILKFNFIFFAVGTIFILGVSLITNFVFSKTFEIPANVESVYITALILVFLITPLRNFSDSAFWIMAFWASIISESSKYILTIRKKHLFNPAALGVLLPSLFLPYTSSWWIATASLLPFTLLGGLLIIRKLRRFDLLFSFLSASLFVIFFRNHSNLISQIQKIFTETPIVFFSTIMLSEPLTTPPYALWRNMYAGFVGIIFAPFIHIGNIFFAPEFVLVIGNVFSFICSPKQKLKLTLKKKEQNTNGMYNLVFENDRKFSFQAGQYMEWTIDSNKADDRGNRRFFTIASSPTEKEIMLGVKLYEKGSTFKKKIFDMKIGETILASGLAGDFILPKNKNKKLAFIAGGIGITPFRSMIKFLSDTSEKRDIALLYANTSASEIGYKDIFDSAKLSIGLSTSYMISGLVFEKFPNGYHGRVDKEIIAERIPDYMERKFYISGSNAFVQSIRSYLKSLGILSRNIRTDYFSGLS